MDSHTERKVIRQTARVVLIAIFGLILLAAALYGANSILGPTETVRVTISDANLHLRSTGRGLSHETFTVEADGESYEVSGEDFNRLLIGGEYECEAKGFKWIDAIIERRLSDCELIGIEGAQILEPDENLDADAARACVEAAIGPGPPVRGPFNSALIECLPAGVSFDVSTCLVGRSLEPFAQAARLCLDEVLGR